MTTARILEYLPRSGMFLVVWDTGDHAVFELLDSVELQVGDEIRGPVHELGSVVLQHVGQGCAFDAYGQTGPSSLQACLKVLKPFR